MSSPSGTEASTTSSSPNSVVATAGPGGNNAPKYGTLVPNRIFVGGISGSTTEAELAQLFSAYGNVRATKIINDRAGVSKGYGFVTFETEEEARRLQTEADCIVLKERKLNIAPAIKKQAATYPSQPFNRGYETAPTVPTGTVFFHNGYPYTYQNGMAFFAAGANSSTQDVAAAAVAANGYVASPYPQPQPPPAYPATTVMFQQPMYIPQQYQYQTMPPSSPVPSQYLYTSAAAGNSLYGTANGGGGNGGGGNGGVGGGGGPHNMSSSNHTQAPGTYYTTGPPPTPSLPPPPPTMPPLTVAPPAPQHHHHHPQPPPPQMAIPEMYLTGPTTAIYAQQAAYSMPVPEVFETPPMTELSSAQSTEDSSSNSSRSGHSNQANDASKINGEGGAKITPSTPVVSLLRLNLQDEGDDEVEGGGSGECEGQDQGDIRQPNKAMRMPAQQSHPQHKRLNVNGNNNHRYHHRPQHHRPNQMHPNPAASQPLYYLTPNYMQGPNHFPTPPHPSGFYGPPPPLNGPPPSSHMHNSVGRGQHHGGNRLPQPHDQRHFGGRSRPNQRSPRPNIPEGKKYPHCVPEGLLSCRSPPLQGSAQICPVYASMGLPAPGINMGNGGRQQHRRFQNGPRKQGNRNGGGDACDGVRPVQVLPPSGQQRQKVGKCNKTVNGTRQGSSTNAGVSGSAENVSRDGSGDGPCMPITPPGTPSPATARELATPVSAVGPETVCQMQALSL